MPHRQKKWKAGDGEALASKKIITEQAAEPMESETSNATPKYTASTATVNTATAATAQAGTAIDEETSNATPEYTVSTPTANTATATANHNPDAPALLEMRDSMKATNALLERLVQAQEISHARQPFITYMYMSQSLQQLPEAQYQFTVKRMTAILHEMQRPIPNPSLQLNHLQHQYLHPHSPSTCSGRIATSPRLSITASSSSLSLSTSLSTSNNCRHP